jgi:hypothetical protein
MDEQLLRDYCEGFFGYGDPTGKYWFIGLEEKGDGSLQSIQDRLALWSVKFKRKAIVDCRRFHESLQMHDLFSAPPKPQKTWDRLILVQLAAEGIASEQEDVCEIRLSNWGNESGDNCLLELLPLPCPKTASWPYKKWTTWPTKPAYKKAIIQHRIDGLRKLVKEYKQPKIVVFYGHRPRKWSKIAGFAWRKVQKEAFPGNAKLSAQFNEFGGTQFVQIYHPASRKTPSEAYFSWVGEELRRRM